MPEKTIKRAKKTLQKKHSAFNKPTGDAFLKLTEEFHLFLMLISKNRTFIFSSSSFFACSPHINIHLHTYALFIH